LRLNRKNHPNVRRQCHPSSEVSRGTVKNRDEDRPGNVPNKKGSTKSFSVGVIYIYAAEIIKYNVILRIKCVIYMF